VKSAPWFNIYSTFLIVAILVYIQMSCLSQLKICHNFARDRAYFEYKIGGNRLNCSQVTAFFRDSRCYRRHLDICDKVNATILSNSTFLSNMTKEIGYFSKLKLDGYQPSRSKVKVNFLNLEFYWDFSTWRCFGIVFMGLPSSNNNL